MTETIPNANLLDRPRIQGGETMELAEIESRISGIPCLIVVTYWEPYVPAKLSGPPEYCYPAEGGCGEWEVRDRRGRPAPWLERKMTEADRERIDRLVFDYMEGRRGHACASRAARRMIDEWWDNPEHDQQRA